LSDPPRILLVTGGGRGIGAAIVRAAVRRHYGVCFSYLQDDAAAQALLHEVRAQGARACAVKGDMADLEFPGRLFDACAQALGPATALVNNAATTGRISPFVDLDRATLRRTVEVNLLGLMVTAQEAARRWSAQGIAGRMVNISSIAAHTGSPGEYVHYAATKGAVESFTVGLGRELASRGIRVNAVAPGTVDTDIHAAGGDPERPARAAAKIPMGRVGTAEEIAEVTLWLLSDAASYVNATVVRAAGGL